MNNKKSMKSFVQVGLLAALTMAGHVQAGQFYNDISMEQMSWNEYKDGSRIVNESVPRMALGIGYRGQFNRQWDYDLTGKIYGGHGHYDGALQDGTPVNTSVIYGGASSEAGLGYTFDLQQHGKLKVATGLGIDRWKRDINGQVEDYTITYSRSGVEYMPGKGVAIGGGIKTVLHTNENAHLDSWYVANPSLHPKRDSSLYLKASYAFNKGLSVIAYTDGYNFKQSDSVPITAKDGSGATGVAYQPKSQMRTYGIKLIYAY